MQTPMLISNDRGAHAIDSQRLLENAEWNMGVVPSSISVSNDSIQIKIRRNHIVHYNILSVQLNAREHLPFIWLLLPMLSKI